VRDAPIPVSAEEHAEMTAAFRRRLNYLIFGFAALLCLLILAFALTPVGPWVIVAVVPAAILYWRAWSHIWNAPTRQLEHRMPVGPDRTREEVHRLQLAGAGWMEFALFAGVMLLIALKVMRREDIFEGWHRLWLLLFALAMIPVGIRWWRRWRYDSKRPPAR
jgi:hypothetical protein